MGFFIKFLLCGGISLVLFLIQGYSHPKTGYEAEAFSETPQTLPKTDTASKLTTTTTTTTTTPTLNWNWQNPVPQGNNLNSISCPDSTDHCMAIGDGGTLLTYDGVAWSLSASIPTTQILYSLSCTSSTFCVAVSNNLATYKFDGSNWSQLPPLVNTPSSSAGNIPRHTPVQFNLYTVFCLDTTHCFAAGLEDIISFDGTNWAKITHVPSALFYGSACTALKDCWLVGSDGNANGVIYHYEGTSWNQVTGIPTGVNSLNAISCPAANKCTAVGDKGSIVDYDGTRWKVSAGLPTDQNLRGLYCNDTNNCTAVGTNGVIVKYDGSQWTMQNSPTQLTLNAIFCPSGGRCLAAGQYGVELEGNGTIWSLLSLRLTQLTLYGLSCPTIFSCWAGGNNGIILHYKGESWSIDRPATPATTGQTIFNLACPTPIWCTAVGSNGLILRHNGINWIKENLDTPLTSALRGVSCPSISRCWAVGEGGKIVTYNGVSWSALSQQVPTTNDLYNISCPDINNCWAVGANGTILYYNGLEWSQVTASPTNLNISSIDCPTPVFCLALTNQNFAFIFNGTDWQMQALPLSHDNIPIDVNCGSPTSCVVSTLHFSFLAFDINSGWSSQKSPNSTTIQKVSCPSEYNCFGVGENGAILAAMNILEVTNPIDDGSGTLVGSLSYNLKQAQQFPGQQIRFNLPATSNNTISLNGSPNLTIPPGTSLNGGCGDGPGITIDGASTVTLAGGNSLNGVHLIGTNTRLVTGNPGAGNNQISCLVITHEKP